MIRKFISITYLVCFITLPVIGQQNLTEIGSLDYQNLHSSDVNDIWGYVDGNGNEYAIIGVNDGGTSVVDISNPSNPTEVFFTSGQSSTWRDIKTYNDHAYITNESGGGLKIIDLSTLPGNTNLSTTTYTGGGTWSSAHNIYIDENGIAYIFGADKGNGGALMLDLNPDPMNPVEVGYFDDWYVHDGMARGDTLYACHVQSGFFSIVDVSDKSNPQVLGTHTTPTSVTHNCWVSDDGNTLFTTDENSGGYITSYDISDPTNITELDRVQSNPGSGSIPHNAHFMNDFLITSYYRDGVVIHDVSKPYNMVQTGNWDSAPTMSGNGFNGCWGAYPWLPSGNLIISDIEDGLHILAPNYQRGCYLEGTVTEQGSGSPLYNVGVEILSPGVSDSTSITGDYSVGYGVSGTYDVVYNKATHIPDTLYNVPLSNDSTTVKDVKLVPKDNYPITIRMIDNVTKSGVSGVNVGMKNKDFSHTDVSGGNGYVTFSPVYVGEYQLFGHKWGRERICIDSVNIGSGQDTLVYEMHSNYYSDNFQTDLNWSVKNTSNEGHWERADPVGTYYSNFQFNASEDSPYDCDGLAYVTGNNSTSVTSDQVDTLATTLTSPVFDASGQNKLWIKYDRWFKSMNQSGFGDDSLIVFVSNGNITEMVDFASGFIVGWNRDSVEVSNMIPLTSTMTVSFRVADWAGDDVTEGAVDNIRITDGNGTSILEEERRPVSIHPNPFQDRFKVLGPELKNSDLTIFDLSGKKVYSERLGGNSPWIEPDLPSGFYLVRITDDSGEVLLREKMIRQ